MVSNYHLTFNSLPANDQPHSSLLENPITPDKNYGSTSTRSNKSQRRTPIRGGKSRPPVSPYLSPFAPQGGAGAANPYSISRNSKKTKPFPRSPRSPRTPHRNSSHKLSTPSRPVRKKPWYFIFLQPEKAQVESWLTSWWKRHLVLVLLPCVFVWVWVAMPFPAHEGETSVSSGPGDKVMGIGNMTGSRNGTGNGSEDEPGRRFFEPSFSFFLFYYYGQSFPFSLPPPISFLCLNPSSTHRYIPSSSPSLHNQTIRPLSVKLVAALARWIRQLYRVLAR
jgi:hypothetical protein